MLFKSTVLSFSVGCGVLLIAGCSTAPQTKAPAAPARRVAPAAPAAPTPAPVPAQPVAAPQEPAKPVPLSPEAEAVVDRFTHDGSGALQHELVDNTGFPAALATLQPGAAAPGVDKPQNYSNMPPTSGLTADGMSAELVERDWSGVVLVPVIAQVSKAYTSGVRLTAIEAHPLKDGRVRIWTRVRNITGAPIAAEVACTFRMEKSNEMSLPRFYYLQVPAGDIRDVFFVSGAGELSNYTVLVRASGR